MRALLEPFKEITIADTIVTIKTALTDESRAALKQLADSL